MPECLLLTSFRTAQVNDSMDLISIKVIYNQLYSNADDNCHSRFDYFTEGLKDKGACKHCHIGNRYFQISGNSASAGRNRYAMVGQAQP